MLSEKISLYIIMINIQIKGYKHKIYILFNDLFGISSQPLMKLILIDLVTFFPHQI